MCEYEVIGGRPLAGRLKVQGAKNSVLPILAAAVLAPGESILHNCPQLSDVTATLEILRILGCHAEQTGDIIRIDTTPLCSCQIPEELMGELRSSVTFLGALLSRCGEADLSYPGGCELGPRPIDLHLQALRTLGVQVREQHGRLSCRNTARLRGREICFSLPSVGATENAMLAAIGCPGVTTITGAAREPEIVDLQKFLRAMGAQIEGAGTPTIQITGGFPLHPVEYTVIGDRMAAATYLCAAGATGGCITLTGVEPEHLTAFLTMLGQAGGELSVQNDTITLTCTEPLCGVRPVRTAPYPGFPTDAQAPFMAALCCGTGTTMFVENMFSSRYGHVDELVRMGADIQVDGRVAVVTGRPLRGAFVRGSDLRGSAALIVAALGAKGNSRVAVGRHIRRGYEDLAGNLRQLGAQITEYQES